VESTMTDMNVTESDTHPGTNDVLGT
jgi:hypothetical protein